MRDAVRRGLFTYRGLPRWPIMASILLLSLLGTGGTTPIPKGLLRGAFDILTLDRFTFWACMLILPLAGLVMGTRSGDIDPGIIFHLVREGGMSIDEIDNLLNRQSGVKGLSGVNDFRELRAMIENEDDNAWLAYMVYLNQLRRFIGSYMIALGRVDAITFTAGVGENDTEVRQDALYNLDMYGIHFDKERNLVRSDQPRMISTEDSPVKVFVVPTNEELAIAQKSAEIAAMAREAGLYK